VKAKHNKLTAILTMIFCAGVLSYQMISADENEKDTVLYYIDIRQSAGEYEMLLNGFMPFYGKDKQMGQEINNYLINGDNTFVFKPQQHNGVYNAFSIKLQLRENRHKPNGEVKINILKTWNISQEESPGYNEQRISFSMEQKVRRWQQLAEPVVLSEEDVKTIKDIVLQYIDSYGSLDAEKNAAFDEKYHFIDQEIAYSGSKDRITSAKKIREEFYTDFRQNNTADFIDQGLTADDIEVFISPENPQIVIARRQDGGYLYRIEFRSQDTDDAGVSFTMDKSILYFVKIDQRWFVYLT